MFTECSQTARLWQALSVHLGAEAVEEHVMIHSAAALCSVVRVVL